MLDIERIKGELSQATVLELKSLVDVLKEEWGVTAVHLRLWVKIPQQN